MSHVSPFDIEPLHLDPIPGYHNGTGSHGRRQMIVDPGSVPGTGKLQFLAANVHVATMLFQINQQVVPNWFGVAIPDNVTDFSSPNIFFHPLPAQAGYIDADYFSKTGRASGPIWPDLFYYMELLGYQLDGAIKNYGAPGNQVLIMPFLTSTATDTGIFHANWQGIVTDILTDARILSGVGGSGPVTLSEVVVSSFSAGYVYSENFRHTAAGVQPLLRQVWDFDGYPKTDSDELLTTATVTAIKYDQASEPGSFHVPAARWSEFPNPAPAPSPPPPGKDIHHAIRNYMFLDAATRR
jgi:hypothetical protein